MQNKKILIYIVAFLVSLCSVFIYFFSGYEQLPENENISDRRNNEVYVYQTEVESAAECTAYEKFDTQNSVCFFECENEEECAEIENLINNEFESWVTEDGDTKKISEDGESNSENLLVKYSVENDEKIVLVFGDDKKEYRDIWTEVAVLSPDTLSNKFIETFEIYSNPSDDTLAFVDDEDSNGKWRMSINLPVHTGEGLREQKSTLIHELSHIYTLNSDQLENFDNCEFVKLSEGCAKENSYINLFYNQFWSGSDIESAQKYAKNKHVSEYAATSGVEDLAESFAYFILEKDGNKLDNTQRDEKIKFFYQFPELVALRVDMRRELGKDIIRAKKIEK